MNYQVVDIDTGAIYEFDTIEGARAFEAGLTKMGHMVKITSMVAELQ